MHTPHIRAAISGMALDCNVARSCLKNARSVTPTRSAPALLAADFSWSVGFTRDSRIVAKPKTGSRPSTRQNPKWLPLNSEITPNRGVGLSGRKPGLPAGYGLGCFSKKSHMSSVALMLMAVLPAVFAQVGSV
jgi:hypothetical protein